MVGLITDKEIADMRTDSTEKGVIITRTTGMVITVIVAKIATVEKPGGKIQNDGREMQLTEETVIMSNHDGIREETVPTNDSRSDFGTLGAGAMTKTLIIIFLGKNALNM